MTRIWTRTTLAAFLAGALVGSGEVHAKAANLQQSREPYATTDVTRAENLYDLALKRIDEGKFAKAARLLEYSNKLDPAMGTQYRLAECYEQLSHFSRAWTTFTEL